MHQTGLAMTREMYVIGFGIFAALTLTACSSEKTSADDQGSNLRSLMERLEFLEENDRKHEAKIRDLETTVEKKTQMISELEILVRKQNAEIKVLKEHYLTFSKSLDNDVTYPEKSNEIKYSMEKKKRIPVQPDVDVVAFYAYMSKTEVAPSTHHMLIFDTVITNEGGGYNPNLGAFIAPTQGVYVFTWTAISSENGFIFSEIVTNTQTVGRTVADSGNHADMNSPTGTVVKALNAGDNVYVRTSSQASHGNIVSYEWARTTFSGWKLN